MRDMRPKTSCAKTVSDDLFIPGIIVGVVLVGVVALMVEGVMRLLGV